MELNRERTGQQVPAALLPLHGALWRESGQAADCLRLLVEWQYASENESDAEAVQSAAIRVTQHVQTLVAPEHFVRLHGNLAAKKLPRSEQPDALCQTLAFDLQRLFCRIDVQSISAPATGSGYSPLYNALRYYRQALQICASVLVSSTNSIIPTTRRSAVRAALHRAQLQASRFVAIDATVVNQFNESAYLQANADVQEAVDHAAFSDGLEHFVLHGATEAKSSARAAPGINIDLLPEPAAADYTPSLDFIMQRLQTSGMFDAKWYRKQYGMRRNPLAHYCKKGYKQGKAPNALFDPLWYRKTYPDIAESTNPAWHYVIEGENEGRMPCEQFDPHWYRSRYRVNGTLALVHYLHDGRARQFNPNPLFDADFYLQSNPDVRDGKMDPVTHYYRFGWKEGRNPCAGFEASVYTAEKLGGDTSINPVTDALLKNTDPASFGNINTSNEIQLAAPTEIRSLADTPGNIRFFANPGPSFENAANVEHSERAPRAKTVAFYLPQFHAFNDNDDWWGTGFSEWRNVARGTPRFSGHYQPRIPRDLGFYDLNDESVLEKQSALAVQNGIEAFCFYYYWFNGKRLMDMPLDKFADMDIDQEFCIMWANENWTRTWDGFDSEVLIEQDYRQSDEDAFLADTSRYFENDRYMRVNGRPLFIMYRPGLMPHAKKTLQRWRRKWTDMLGVEPWILMVQGFGDEDPREFGLDGAVEFPPHKLCKSLPSITDQLNVIDPAYTGHAHAYEDVINCSLDEEPPAFALVKTVVPHWDNDARREGCGYVMHGSTPALYERWLGGAIDYAIENPFHEQPLVFINAWNEWAEGAYLEPDVHYGHAYLNATKRAVYGVASTQAPTSLLLVGHDAHKHGAQMLLLNMARIFTRQFGMDVNILIKQGGPMLDAYRETCPTMVLEELGAEHLEGWIRLLAPDMAICNTTVTGDLVPVLKRSGVCVTSLIHELPQLIADYGLGNHVQRIAESANHVVFPAENVQRGFHQFATDVTATEIIQPQGSYKQVAFDLQAREAVRQQLGVAASGKLVINAGYADRRKGFDIFLRQAIDIVEQRDDISFAWIGGLATDMRELADRLLSGPAKSKIHLIDFTDRIEDYYSACDCFFLTSREDPYPTVVLEAFAVGVPVVLFKAATGCDALMHEFGYAVDQHDSDEIKSVLVRALFDEPALLKQQRADYVQHNCRFDDYCFGLLQLSYPQLKKVSVVVPNFNYAHYMQSRLESVFKQGFPVFEVLVLDDCSADDSINVINTVANDAGRSIQLLANEYNSGNVFRQWRHGLELSRGDLVWIAEADDLADPTFIARSVAAFKDDTPLCFCNSVQIGTKDQVLATNYNYYYDEIDPALFRSDFQMSGAEFIRRAMAVRNVILNVSSVMWRREALADALDSVGESLLDYQLVGDWYLYLEVLSAEHCTVAYLADSLNTHRRHDASVTHSLDLDLHLQEIQSMHVLALTKVKADDQLRASMRAYVDELHDQFDIEKPDNKLAA